MKGKRTDAETKARIIEEKLNNPDLSSRDISNKLGNVSNDTVCDVINKDLPQVATESERIAQFVDSNDNIISIGQQLLKTYIPVVEIEGMNDLNSLSSIMEKAFKQNELTKGRVTERVEVNNGYEMLMDIQNGKLGRENAYDVLRAMKE